MNEGRTKLLLGILGALLLIVAWTSLGPSGGGGDDDFGPVTTVGRIPGAGRETKPVVEEVLDLRVADLQARPHD